MTTWRVLVGDVRAQLATLADRSVQCVVTSPPYWGLRDYGTDGQIGLEPTPDAYVAQLVAVFRDVRRVLRVDGVVWLNLGDSYATQGGRGESRMVELGRPSDRAITVAAARESASGTKGIDILKPKDLCGIPWRVAFALQADGWYLRADVIWSKCNPMPESVTDRPTKSHEYIFLLSQSERYFYDAAAIAEPSVEFGDTFRFPAHRALAMGREPSGNERPEKYNTVPVPETRNVRSVWTMTPPEPEPPVTRSLHMQGTSRNDGDRWRTVDGGVAPRGMGRQIRSVWTMTTANYPDAHFATFPEALPERCIKAGTSAHGACPACGAPWRFVVDRAFNAERLTIGSRMRMSGADLAWRTAHPDQPRGWSPSCDCAAGDPVPCVVLDPFCGSGTTGQIAIQLGRAFVGIELNPAYAQLARQRIGSAAPLFATETPTPTVDVQLSLFAEPQP